MGKIYLKTNKEVILDFARDCYKSGNITKRQLEDVYIKHFLTTN